MRKRITKEVPDTLPPSTIFLDDLQVIEDLVRSSMNSEYALDGFIYEFDGKFVVDSIDELKADRGHTKKFKMSVKYRRIIPPDREVAEKWGIFAVDDWSHTSMGCPRCLNVEEREFNHELKKIFEARKSQTLAIIEAIPTGQRMYLYFFSAVLIGFLTPQCFMFAEFIYSLHLPQSLSTLIYLLILSVGLIVVIYGYKALNVLSIYSNLHRVNFYFERERQLERQGSRKKWRERIILAILAAVLGALGTLFAQWLGSGPKH